MTTAPQLLDNATEPPAVGIPLDRRVSRLPQPYYADDAVTLYHGDAMELLPLLQIADAIVTDPPYGETSLDWDVWPDGWPALAMLVAP